MLNPFAGLRGSGFRIVGLRITGLGIAGLLAASALAISLWGMPGAAQAQARKDSAVLAMALEPPGLDPTTGAASAIAEVVLYNIFETLTKIKSDGNVAPLLAESWTVSPDLKSYTFKLRRDVKFQNGEPFNAETVKVSHAPNCYEQHLRFERHVLAF